MHTPVARRWHPQVLFTSSGLFYTRQLFACNSFAQKTSFCGSLLQKRPDNFGNPNIIANQKENEIQKDRNAHTILTPWSQLILKMKKNPKHENPRLAPAHVYTYGSVMAHPNESYHVYTHMDEACHTRMGRVTCINEFCQV